MSRGILLAGLLAGCAAPGIGETVAIESSPSGAEILRRSTQRDGSVAWQVVGRTPLTLSWAQVPREEAIMIRSGEKSMLVSPILGRPRIFVDFSSLRVTGARLLGS